MTEHLKQKEPIQSALIPNDDFETPVEDCPF